jgi:hypothetical protein
MSGHVTFIHGIANQPAPERMLRMWKQTLADGGDGVDLDVLGITSSFIYWADVMYEKNIDEMPDQESMVFEGVAANQVPEVDETYLETTDGAERAFIDSFIETYNLDADPDTPVPDISDVDVELAYRLEAIPLPWVLKRPLMRILLRDVHHYLFNTDHSPRTDVHFQVQTEIRRRFVESTSEVTIQPHVVIAHSMGTVITYDLLKRVAESAPVDAVITLGSPLGMSEIQDQMKPEYSSHDGYASKAAQWFNFSDRLDPVCGPDPRIGNDYKKSGEAVIADQIVKNTGWFRHPVDKYLRQPSVQAAVRTSLGIG